MYSDMYIYSQYMGRKVYMVLYMHKLRNMFGKFSNVQFEIHLNFQTRALHLIICLHIDPGIALDSTVVSD